MKNVRDLFADEIAKMLKDYLEQPEMCKEGIDERSGTLGFAPDQNGEEDLWRYDPVADRCWSATATENFKSC